MSVRELLLVRHGQSLGNVAAEAAARNNLERIDVPARDADVELSDLGRQQAAAVGTYLADLPEGGRPQVVWTSPFVRARTTAEIALEAAGIECDYRVDERLRDRDMGITDALTAAGIAAKYPEEVERRAWLGKFYYRPPGGESWADVVQRVRGVLTDLAGSEKHERVLVAAHDVVLLLFCYVAEGMDEQAVLDRSKTNGLRNASITRLVRDEDAVTGWRVADYNMDDHLRAAGIAVTDQPGASDEVGPAPAEHGAHDSTDPDAAADADTARSDDTDTAAPGGSA